MKVTSKTISTVPEFKPVEINLQFNTEKELAEFFAIFNVPFIVDNTSSLDDEAILNEISKYFITPFIGNRTTIEYKDRLRKSLYYS